MRLMFVAEDPRYRALIRHHLSCEWPDVEVVAYNPKVNGPLAQEFLAQGFGAVLLCDEWTGGQGIDWLPELTARQGFAPVIFMTDRADSQIARAARDAGAFAVIGKERLNHDRLIATVNSAVAAQDAAQAEWRSSDAAREAATFCGATIRGYRRISKLASGSVSELFLAESERAGCLVVFKVTRDQRKADGVDQSFERFLQEYEIVRRIKHPSIVKLYDLGVTDEHAYLVMEYFRRGDLRSLMRNGVTMRQALRFAHAIARALEAVHAAGVLHRDLKPGNVMLREDGGVALIDFGMAKHEALTLEITDAGLIFGTPHYMSPEQGHAQPLDERSDLYSLGVILYELLTGHKPFDADNPMAIIYMHAKREPERLPEDMAMVQPVLDRLLAKRPDDRYRNARAVVDALGELMRQTDAAERAA
ncbi:MAG: protein kinase [Steroidobacteraceae bacterium]